MQETKAHIIVVGNEKGGSGKSTVAMHVAVGLLRLGYSVGTIDLDSHQATLTAYMKNRWRAASVTRDKIPAPEHIHIGRGNSGADVFENRDRERGWVEGAIEALAAKHDFVVIDTPGSDRFMSVVGHSYANTLITPVNDSFLDLDLLAKIDVRTMRMMQPGVYTEMVWDLRRQREKRDGRTISWFVMQNRLAALEGAAKPASRRVAEELQWSLGFILTPGFAERAIYRELFLQGLTLLDLREGDSHTLSLANINARQEVRNLVRMILPRKDVSTLSLLKTY
jgi:chromosome partitioning protein